MTVAPYNQFLDYMCPNSSAKGLFPPDGSDPDVCQHPIYGIYDDHDFGWNNGNSRELEKRTFKNLYLDAIGVPMTSIRRNANRGAWTSYQLNSAESSSKWIDVFLLDERYERETLPCDTRRAYCESLFFLQSSKNYSSFPSYLNRNELAWCEDFLRGGWKGQGTCCSKDEQIFFQWCLDPAHRHHSYYRDVCDVSYENFGMKSLIYDPVHDDIIPPPPLDGTSSTVLHDDSQESPFCEVLGKSQRKWLKSALRASRAPVKLIVSGSVLLYDPSVHVCQRYPLTLPNGTIVMQEIPCRCGGDNLDCYRVAQRELLHLFSSTKGCVIILTGDYHFGDIKRLKKGPETIYSSFEYYDSSENLQDLYQIMSSGLTSSTARDWTCEDFRLDPMGLRTHAECSFVTGPNFGKLLFQYDAETESLQTITLQILSGSVANQVLLETVVDATSCNPM